MRAAYVATEPVGFGAQKEERRRLGKPTCAGKHSANERSKDHLVPTAISTSRRLWLGLHRQRGVEKQHALASPVLETGIAGRGCDSGGFPQVVDQLAK